MSTPATNPDPATTKSTTSSPEQEENEARKARMLAFRSITNALAKLSPKEAKAVLASVGALYAE